MTKNQFIAKAITELLEDNFSIRLPMTPSIDGKYGGWFASETKNKEFVVAMKRDCAFEIFVHEYSHYLQWKHNRDFFNKKSKGCDIVFDWIEGGEYSPNCVKKAISNVIEIEWDCECTALGLIKKYKLPIDKENYIRGANCYLFFYHSVLERRAWTSENKSPYSKRLRKLASTTLNDLSFYLDENNYPEKLRKGHNKII